MEHFFVTTSVMCASNIFLSLGLSVFSCPVCLSLLFFFLSFSLFYCVFLILYPDLVAYKHFNLLLRYSVAEAPPARSKIGISWSRWWIALSIKCSDVVLQWYFRRHRVLSVCCVLHPVTSRQRSHVDPFTITHLSFYVRSAQQPPASNRWCT